MLIPQRYIITILLCFVALFSSCATKKYKEQQQTVTLAVMPFMQPTALDELLAGSILPYRVLATQKELQHLDALLKEALTKFTGFRLLFLQPDKKSQSTTMLEYLVALGKAHNADFVLLPQLLNWKPQEKKKHVIIPVTVWIDYYLIDVNKKELIARANYFENSPITTNDLRYKRVPNGIFYRTYVDRNALAEDSILMMLEDFNFVYDRKNKNLFLQKY